MSHPEHLDDVGVFARAIVAKRVGVLAAISGVLSVLVSFHAIDIHQSDAVTGGVVTGFNLLATVVGVVWAQSGTTPADPALAPTSKEGAKLVVATPKTDPSATDPAVHPITPSIAAAIVGIDRQSDISSIMQLEPPQQSDAVPLRLADARHSRN